MTGHDSLCFALAVSLLLHRSGSYYTPRPSIFRLAYDEVWKQYSAGSTLASYLMEHVIDVDKVEEIDFTTGNDACKLNWMIARRERWKLDFVYEHKSEQRAGRSD
jgi:hypothetical protein